MAVRHATAGKVSNGSVTIERCGTGAKYASRTGLTQLSKVAKFTKDLPSDFMNSQGNFVTDAFIDYLKPLVDGMPVLGALKRVKI
jgi:6-phosphofructokinase 1